MGIPLGTASARHAFDRILRLSRGSGADSAFLAELSLRLKEIVPFDASFWAGADPVTMLATSPSRIERVRHEYCVPVLGERVPGCGRQPFPRPGTGIQSGGGAVSRH
jgi:hypothetical protein